MLEHSTSADDLPHDPARRAITVYVGSGLISAATRNTISKSSYIWYLLCYCVATTIIIVCRDGFLLLRYHVHQYIIISHRI